MAEGYLEDTDANYKVQVATLMMAKATGARGQGAMAPSLKSGPDDFMLLGRQAMAQAIYAQARSPD